MIITKQWLNEWIELGDISTSKLCEIFNSIGLEVDSVNEHKMPELVVVGFVKEKLAHPDADKLSVCTVDVGKEEVQIVCGAKNVAQGQLVPVALNGAKLPNGLKIKKAKLRGIESNGMICSSSELGLPKINDGIMALDESLGKLEVGMELRDIKALNDDVIDLELTANRGDCLSIHGVARDLSVYLKKDLKQIPNVEEDENLLGIGRLLSLHVEDKVDSSLVYKVLEYSSNKDNLLLKLRLALVELEYKNEIECFLNYVIYSTGVLFRAYNFDLFQDGEKAQVYIKKTKEGFDGVFTDDKCLSYIGYLQEKPALIEETPVKIVVEASYIKPEIISRLGMDNKKISSDFHYYRSSRGSEPDLEFGVKYLSYLLKDENGISLYGGVQNKICELSERNISFTIEDIVKTIGQDIPKNDVVQILKGLEFEVVAKAEQDMISVKVPPYRHDISDMQDICEEIVRIVGIDNIKPTPYRFAERSRTNKSYNDFKKRYDLRLKSVGAGFFESIHYVFDDKEKIKKYQLESIIKSLELANPITNELNTLRSSLALHLIEAVSLNVKNSISSVNLFEIGKVFDKNREEYTNIAWISSGYTQTQSVQNHGKPALFDLQTFALKISSVIGEFSLQKDKPKNALFSPYEYANVIVNAECVGHLGRLHVKVENEYSILNTYICELDFDKLSYERRLAKAYSKLPSSSRELSLLVPKDMQYAKIKECIESLKEKNLVRFFPIDRFESKDLGENVSLSIKFIFQDDNQTLEDEQVTKIIDLILDNLKTKLHVSLR